MNDCIDRISIYRLNPAYMEPASFDTYPRSSKKGYVSQRMDL